MKELSSLKRDKELLEEEIRELKTGNTISELSDEYFKKSRSCSLSNGAKSAHKILKTLEGERQKHTLDKYKSEIIFLARQNDELKRIVESYTGASEEHIKSIVSRAAKLHNYIAAKLNKPPVEAALCGRRLWDVIDAFTKQARVYIRITESSGYNMEKEKAFGYSEKEVSDRTNNLEAYENISTNKAQLDTKKQTDSMRVLEARNLATLDSLSKLLKEQAANHEPDTSERRLSILRSDTSDLLSTQSKWSEAKEKCEECLLSKLESGALRSGSVLEGQKENIREYAS